MFFDRYCKGIRNGWESTPRVRIEVQDHFDITAKGLSCLLYTSDAADE